MKHIEADHKTGRQALLAHLCCVGEEVCAVMARLLSAGVRPCFCWANTLEVLCGDYAERVLWVLPPLSSLENWLPLGACLQLWRLLRAGAPFQITGFFVCFVGFCFGFLGSVWLFYISPVSIALVMFGPTLTRSFQSWAYPMYEFSLWAGSDITAWEKRTSQPVIWDTGRATFSILDSPC